MAVGFDIVPHLYCNFNKTTTLVKNLVKAVAILSIGKILFAFQDVIIKEMSGDYAVHQIVSIRGLAAIPVLLLLLYFTIGFGSLRSHRATLHLIRGALMFFAFLAFYIALAEISLTLATALFFTAPFFITLLSIPLLDEQVGLKRFVGILVGFAGVLIILRPDTERFNLTALLPIVAAFFYACCQLMVRFYKMTAPPSIMSLYASVSFLVLGCLFGLILSGMTPDTDAPSTSVFLLRQWTVPTPGDLMLLLLTGISSSIGFMASSKAYQLEQASSVAPFEYVMIIWVTVLSYLFWGEIPDLQTSIGLVLIIGSGVYVIRREQRKEIRPMAYSGLTRR